MKKENVVNFTDFLFDLKINGFDREIRSAIIKNSIMANKIKTDFQDTINQAKNKFTKDLSEEEIKLIELYRNQYETASPEEKKELNIKIVTNCSNVLKAEQEINQFVLDLLHENVSCEFVKIDRDRFVDQCVESGIDITPKIIELLEELFK
jgi:hypothetical protein